jgi:hypothetical protein
LRPIHHRLDGKKVRYVAPQGGHAWARPSARYQVDVVVFLNCVPVARSELVPLKRMEALSRLAEELCPLGEGLTAAKLDQLLAWISRVDCFELQYSPLDDGVARLAGLCR